MIGGAALSTECLNGLRNGVEAGDSVDTIDTVDDRHCAWLWDVRGLEMKWSEKLEPKL